MQTLSLLAVNRERLRPFFERVPELFEMHHHQIDEDPEGYEELPTRCIVHILLTCSAYRRMDGMEQLRISSEQETMLRLFLLAIRYPDTLLFESLDEVLTADLRRMSAYLHFTSHTYAIWDDDTRKGLGKLGFEIPGTKNADPFIYGAYVGTIELLKDLAPFTCFLEHDVPRQRLFQAALAAYGRE